MTSRERRYLILTYAVGVVVPAGATVLLLLAATTGADHPAPSTTHPAPAAFDIGRVLLTIAIVVIAAHAGGMIGARLRQPRVVGQAIVGLLLGPSVLGQVAPDLSRWLRHEHSSHAIDLLSQLGVILFVFLIGRELASANHRRQGAAAMAVGQTMIAVPLLCGVLTASLLLDRYRPPQVGAVPYMLFVGVVMSATALPVLAHILAERRLLTSRVGVLGTSAAVIGDATIWCLLTVTMCLVQRGSVAATIVRLGAALVFVAITWWLVRPLLRRTLTARGDSSHALPALLIAGLLLSALITEHLGLHSIFGAFLVGVVVPPTSVVVQRVGVMAEGLTEWLLLPLFFTAVGARTQLDLITDPRAVGLCLTVLLIAVVSKVVSAGAAGRAIGLGWRDSAALGSMLSCRGLTELLILNIGLTAGIIDARVFALFVVMALVTTAATGPLLDTLGMRRPHTAPAEPDRTPIAEATRT